MSQPKLTRLQAELTLEALRLHKGSRELAAAELKLPTSTLKTRIRIIKETFPDMETVPVRAPGPAAKTLDESIEIQRAKSSERIATSKLKEATAEIIGLRDQIKDLKWAAGEMASFKPAAWTLPDRAPHKSEHMPYLLTSDFQVGEVVRKEETEHGYGYDVDTFKRRYRRMVETSIYLARQHVGPGWTYPGFIYARGGDPISGGIHKELLETDSMTAPEAARVCAEVEVEGIATLAKEFGKVMVPCVGHSNHSRITFKPQSKRARANSYDMLIDLMIMDKLNAMPKVKNRVQFQLTESPDVYFPIYDHLVLLTHGDNIGSRGGQGFIGPVATMIRGWQRVIMEQLAIGRRVDSVHNGHFHTPCDLGWGVGNGSMPGYSEYAKSFRLRPSPPQQRLAFYHPRRGVVDIKPLILTEA